MDVVRAEHIEAIIGREGVVGASIGSDLPALWDIRHHHP
jgi:hypothetical protein